MAIFEINVGHDCPHRNEFEEKSLTIVAFLLTLNVIENSFPWEIVSLFLISNQ